MNLGVYVSTLNEEVLIEAVLTPVLKAFPQVEVIDLGSTDHTLDIVSKFNVPVNRHVPEEFGDGHAGRGWTALKNQYTDKHDWVFFVDGDELYNTENLNLLKEKLNGGVYTAYRTGWKMVREVDGQKQVSEMRVNGAKLFRSVDYRFTKAWPFETLPNLPCRTLISEPKEECEVWCWHGVLLERTKSIEEDSFRKYKRGKKYIEYDTKLKWTNIEEWPWL